jgi:ATP-dependent 26S proteasome regulatory subunit
MFGIADRIKDVNRQLKQGKIIEACNTLSEDLEAARKELDCIKNLGNSLGNITEALDYASAVIRNRQKQKQILNAEEIKEIGERTKYAVDAIKEFRTHFNRLKGYMKKLEE